MNSPPRKNNHVASTTWIGPLVCILGVLGALVTLLILNPVAREVATQTAIALFTIFSTPFILEFTSAVLMVLALFMYNKWRRQKEGSDWVYLISQEPDENDTKPTSPTESQHLQSLVKPEKPTSVDEYETAAEVLEGYLERGMPAQAQSELTKYLGKDGTTPPRLVPLCIRILGANLETAKALELLHQTVDQFPQSMPNLLQACLDNARWFLHHLQRRDLATLWVKEAQQLHPLIISESDPLHELSQQA